MNIVHDAHLSELYIFNYMLLVDQSLNYFNSLTSIQKYSISNMFGVCVFTENGLGKLDDDLSSFLDGESSLSLPDELMKQLPDDLQVSQQTVYIQLSGMGFLIMTNLSEYL